LIKKELPYNLVLTQENFNINIIELVAYVPKVYFVVFFTT